MFFLKEVCITRDLTECNRIRDILAKNGIRYTISTNFLSHAGRYHGNPFINTSAAYQYRIFVRKKDYVFVESILNK